MGYLTFSNFNYQYLVGVTTGCGAIGEPSLSARGSRFPILRCMSR
jgi:hypothetical protein